MRPEDEVTQAERRRILLEERRAATYLAQAQLHTDLELVGGRFAKISKTTIVGVGPVSYPRLPEGSPWAKDECPPEPLIDGTGDGNRLGYRIDGGSDKEGDAAAPEVKRAGFRRF